MTRDGTAESKDLILRDLLAIDRTVLANERTLLAYLRTMMTFLVVGIGAIQFVERWWAGPLGAVLILTGPLLFLFGLWRYRRVRRDVLKAGR